MALPESVLRALAARMNEQDIQTAASTAANLRPVVVAKHTGHRTAPAFYTLRASDGQGLRRRGQITYADDVRQWLLSTSIK